MIAILRRGIKTYFLLAFLGIASASAYAQVEVTIESEDVECAGDASGSAFVTVIQGDPSFDYLWNTGDTTAAIDELLAGKYWVTTTDANGNSSIDTIVINEPPPLSGIVVNTKSSCNGVNDGTATVLPNGGSGGYTYKWSDPLMQTTRTADSLEAGIYFVTVTDSLDCSLVFFTKIFDEGNINAAVSSTDANCIGNNGTAMVDSVTTGTPPFTYLWSNDSTTAAIDMLIPGSYSVTVTDSFGCEDVKTVVVGLDSVLSTELEVVDVDCESLTSGSATITVLQGMADYTVVWRDSNDNIIQLDVTSSTNITIDQLSAGTYSATVLTADSCEQFYEFTISTVDSLNVTLSGTPPTCISCQDGIGIVTVSPGDGPFTYVWSNGADTSFVDTLGFGIYSVTVTDTLGCMGSDTLIFTPEGDTFVVIITTTDVTCEDSLNGTATIDTILGGVPPFTVLWDNGSDSLTAVGLSPGIHTVTITDANGISVVDTFNINPAIPIEISALVKSADCLFDTAGSITLTVDGGNPPYQYQWEAPIMDTDSIVTGLNAGFYSVTVTDENGCPKDTIIEVPDVNPLEVEGFSIPDTCGRGQGSITVNVLNGSGNYTYEWQPIVSDSFRAVGLTLGVYRVKITDNITNCSKDTSFIVSDFNFGFRDLSRVTPDTCGSGVGKIIVEINRGSGAFIYEWSPNVSDSSIACDLIAGSYTVTFTDTFTTCPDSLTFEVEDVNPLNLTEQRNIPDTCGQALGLLEVMTTGGSGDYTYAWTPNVSSDTIASGLTEGTYTITVTDNISGCTDSLEAVVDDANPLNLTEQRNIPDTCGQALGLLEVMTTGGSGDYTYAWTPNVSSDTIASGLTEGTYTITVTDNVSGCTDSLEAVVDDANPLNLTEQRNIPDTCGQALGLLEVMTTGGSGDYTYAWTPNVSSDTIASGLTEGTYTITVTDNISGCTDSLEAAVDDANPLNLTEQRNIPDTCGQALGLLEVMTTGGSGDYTYAWTPNVSSDTIASGLTEGTYTITVTDNISGCTDSLEAVVDDANPLNLTEQRNIPDTCGQALGLLEVMTTGGSGDYTYAWTPNVSSDTIASGLTEGTYTITVTDNISGCTDSLEAAVDDANPLNLTEQRNIPDTCGQALGLLEVMTTGGSGDYTYAWTPNVSNDTIASGLTEGTYTITVTDNISGCTDSLEAVVDDANPLNLTEQRNIPDTCGQALGLLEVMTTGGSGDYTYAWTPNVSSDTIASGLTEGTYTITVTDNISGCTDSLEAAVDDANPLNLTEQRNIPDTCGQALGLLEVMTTGGSGDYTYAWTPNVSSDTIASGLTEGTYTITVTDNISGCTDSLEAVVDDANPLNLTEQRNIPDTCGQALGLLEVMTTGGSGDYTYAWTPNVSSDTIASGLTEGTYTITVTDNVSGCTDSLEAVVDDANPLNLTEQRNIPDTCGQALGLLEVMTTGGSGDYTYAWTPNVSSDTIASGLTEGTYTITVTDNISGCTDSLEAVVDDANPLNLTEQRNIPDTCGQALGLLEVMTTGGSGDYTYAWTPNVSSDTFASGLTEGTYTITVTDNISGCTDSLEAVVDDANPLNLTEQRNIPDTCGQALGLLEVMTTGGSGDYSYAWTPSVSSDTIASGLTEGTYTITVTDNISGCTDSLEAVVDDANPLNLTEQRNIPDTCGQALGLLEVMTTGGSGDYSYAWTPSVSSDTIASGLTEGTYTITVTDNISGCTDSLEAVVDDANPLNLTEQRNIPDTCGQALGLLEVMTTGGSGDYTYAWTPNVSSDTIASGLTEGTYTITVTDNISGCTDSLEAVVDDANPLNLTEQRNIPDTCGQALGLLEVMTTGGSGDYTYAWTPNVSSDTFASGLTEGTYTITVTDNISGCTDSLEAVVDDANPLNLTEQRNIPDTCGQALGLLEVMTTGGSGDYSYAWTPSVSSDTIASGLTEGTYTITVTDNISGCTDSLEAVVDDANPLNLTEQRNIPDTCGQALGLLEVMTTGGSGDYTYAWTPNVSNDTIASGLTEGTYTITVTDNVSGCTDSLEAAVDDANPLNLTEQRNIPDTCGQALGLLEVMTTGGSGDYTYAWTPNVSSDTIASGLTEGTYTITVTDNVSGCTDSLEAVVDDANPLNLTEQRNIPDTCGQALGLLEVMTTGGSGDYTYAWTPNVSNDTIASGLTEGTYTITVTDNISGCTDSLEAVVDDANPLNLTEQRNIPDTCGQALGLLEVMTTGGSGDYTYAWTPNVSSDTIASGLTEGTYTITVTDNISGCTDSLELGLGDINPLQLSSEITNIDCAGDSTGQIILDISGSVQPINIQWENTAFGNSDTLTNLPAGKYKVTVSDARNCERIDSFEVIENPALNITFDIDNISCDLAIDDGSITVNVSGGTSPYSYEWDNLLFGDTNRIDSLSAGNYSLTVTDALGCMDSATAQVRPGLDASIDFSVEYDSCALDSIELLLTAFSTDTNMLDNWQWIIDSTEISTNRIATFTVNDSSTLTITLIAGIGDCRDTLTKEITVEPIELNIQDTAIACIPIGVQLNQGGDTTYVYSWSPAAGLSDSSAASPIATPDSNTLFTVDILAINGTDTCILQDSVFVIVPDEILLELPNDTTICSDSIELTAMANQIVAIVWNIGDSTIGAGSTITVMPDDTVRYIATATDAFGCSVTDTVTIVGGALDVAFIDSPIVVCQGQETGILLTNGDLDDMLVIDWSPDSLFDNDGMLDPGFNTDSAGEFFVFVEVSNQYGCEFIDSTQVIVLDSSSDADFVTTVQCDGLTVNFLNRNAPFYRLFFDINGNPLDFSEDSLSIYAYPAAGTYEIALIKADTLANGCQDTIFRSIEVVDSSLFTLGFEISKNACSDSVEVILSDTSSHAQDSIVSWSWEIGDSTYTGKSITATLGDTTVEVTLTVVTSLGCETTLIDTVRTNLVIVELQDTIMICRGDTVELNPGGNPDYDYFWIPTDFLDNGNAPNPRAFPPATTTFAVSIINDDGNELCEFSSQITVVVDSLSSQSAIDLDSIILCADSDTLIASTLTEPGLTYEWSLNPNFDPIISQNSSVLANPNSRRDRVYYLRVTNAAGCAAIDSVLVGNFSPLVSIPDTQLLCVGDTIEIMAFNLFSGDTLSYDWEPKGEIISGDGTNTIFVAPSVSTAFTLDIENQFGCTAQAISVVEINDFALGIDAVADPEVITIGNSSQLDLLIDAPGQYTYRWTPDSSLNSGTVPNPVASPTGTTTYEVEVTDANGCIGLASVTVVVDTLPCVRPFIFLPNAFTPNDDGVNDALFLRGEQVDEMYLTIYNRWGQLVFETRDQSIGWDGRFKGALLEPDVYGYYLEVLCIGGETLSEQGNVSILK